MISIDKRIVEEQIRSFKSQFNNQHDSIKENLIEMRRLYSKNMSKEEAKFLNKIIVEFKTKTNSLLIEYDLDSIKDRIGEIPPQKITQNRKNKIIYLKDLILMAFGYDYLRSDFYPTFYDSIGIRACVYCNSQLTVSVSKNRYPVSKKGRKKPLYSLGNEVSAKFQLDHYYPKSKYPYLSASVFNLYPSCATCNNIKSANPVDFRLYTNKLEPSRYRFYLDTDSKAEYLKSNDIDDIKVKFLDPDKETDNIKSPGSFEDTFHLSSIYNTQKDIIEELFYKRRAYDESYKSVLKKSFSSIFNDTNLSKRIILGNYTDEADIHKRPLSKFMQDIADDIFFNYK